MFELDDPLGQGQLCSLPQVLRNGRWSEEDASILVPGDVISIKLGDIIPADSHLLEGDPLKIDQSALTGESLLVMKGPGDGIYSGSTYKQCELEAVVIATGVHTFFGKAAHLVDSANQVGHFQKYAAREAEIVAQAGRKYAITLSINMAGRGTDIILGENPKMLTKEILEDTLLSILTQEVPKVEIDSGTTSKKVSSKVKVGPSSLALLAKTALVDKYVCKNEGKRWTYNESRNIISESIEISQSMELIELQKLVDEQTETYPLGPSIALAYLSVLKDSESHSFNEGLEVKRLGGLHVIGTSLHESRRIDNQSRETRGSWINTVYGELTR